MTDISPVSPTVRKSHPVLLAVALMVLGIVIGAGAVFFYLRQIRTSVAPVTPVIVNTEPASPSTSSTATEQVPENNEDQFAYPTDTRATALTVDWQAPKLQNLSDVFAKDSTTSKRFANINVGSDGDFAGLDQDAFYLRGTVPNGEWKGSKLYHLTLVEEGMGTTYYQLPMLVSPDRTRCTLVGISPDVGSSAVDVLKDVCAYAPKMTLANVNDPASVVTIPGKGDIYFTRKTGDYAENFGDCTAMVCAHESLKIMGKTSDGRPVYEGGGEAWGGGRYLSLFNAFGDQFKYTQIKARLASEDVGATDEPVTWDSAYQNLKSFSYAVPSGGCGVTPDVMALDADAQGVALTDLVKAGVTESGKNVYLPKDPINNPQEIQAYDNWMDYDQGGTKPSIGEFLKKYPQPIYLRQDIFGRWIKFQITQIQPIAECGKPVIYLYPAQTEQVSVKLPSFIQVTKSEPSYPSKGWNVIAHPDGTLDYSDGNTYGSLFWEGIGVNYQEPAEGFLVKDGEVDAFLTRTLAQYGLNERESAEFREFWVPLMTGAPYYRVSFLTDAWSKAAPLNVSPKPDTSIRIFMDWHKLSAPVQIAEPKIVTPARQGFTLVEWGGILWK